MTPDDACFPMRQELFPSSEVVPVQLAFQIRITGHPLFQDSPDTRGQRSLESNIPSVSLSCSQLIFTVIVACDDSPVEESSTVNTTPYVPGVL